MYILTMKVQFMIFLQRFDKIFSSIDKSGVN